MRKREEEQTYLLLSSELDSNVLRGGVTGIEVYCSVANVCTIGALTGRDSFTKKSDSIVGVGKQGVLRSKLSSLSTSIVTDTPLYRIKGRV